MAGTEMEIEPPAPAAVNRSLSIETGLPNPKVVEPYSAMLNLTDVSYGVKGHNKFYQIMVIEDNGFYFWAKWGRVGAPNPASSLSPCSSKAEAIIEFKKKFHQKTKNEWGTEFNRAEGKYVLVDVQSDNKKLESHIRFEKKRRELVEKAKSFPIECDTEVANLMEFIWDFDRMKRTMRELNLDPEQCPLGQLSKSQIQKGYKILREIYQVLTTSNRESKILELTNDFYTNIPQNFGMKRPPPINRVPKVKEKLALLDTLLDLEIANSLSMRSLKLLETRNPLDVYYSQLKCRISAVSNEFKGTLQGWIDSTHAPSHNFRMEVVQAFEIDRENESARYWSFSRLPNKKLLWHGSRITNIVGILSQGLRIAPKEAPSSGYMFGKGIYLADLSSKSAMYCNASPSSPEGILLLCEVALGNSHQVLKAKSFKRPPSPCHSVLGVGRTSPTDEFEVYPGVSLYTGNLKENPQAAQSELRYNEYIVYDIGQIKLRYLIRCQFTFN
ncbi:unnamed protein product [Blepharisma stoltei]|uniref:Poly [ADP-ribose] polymerase n=1 Tax=Blepharisma stoltei TaxID=1481888 RepID=A0AAU9JPK0_9CILI|nr:unnamed protein product [Blepharisma stoltei]